MESVLYSTQVITLESVPKPQRAHARSMRLMKREVERPLAAILILNTVANTAGAALAGWAAGEVWGAQSLVVFSIAFTLAILFFSEIIPKTIGAVYWRGLWRSSLMPLKMMMLLTTPLITVVQLITGLITKKRVGEPQVSEAEILAAARLGAREGEISELEQELISNIIKLEDQTARDIMTPRTVIFSENGDRSLSAVSQEAQEWPYTGCRYMWAAKRTWWVMCSNTGFGRRAVQPQQVAETNDQTGQIPARKRQCSGIAQYIFAPARADVSGGG